MKLIRRRFDLPFYSHCLHSLPQPSSLPTVCSPYVWSRTRRDLSVHRWSHHRILKSSVWKNTNQLSAIERSGLAPVLTFFKTFFFYHRCLLSGPSRLSLLSRWLLKIFYTGNRIGRGLPWQPLVLQERREVWEQASNEMGFTKNTNHNEGLIPVWALSPINKRQNISIATEIVHGSVQLSSFNTDCLGCRVKFMKGNKIQASRFILDIDMEYVWHSEPSVCQIPIATCTCMCANPSAFRRELFSAVFQEKVYGSLTYWARLKKEREEMIP